LIDVDMASEQFSLCWDNFHKNMSSGMNSLLENEDLVDVTLAVEGKYLKAHKMVLSVCSPYFRELFKMNPCKHPIVFMKDVSYIAMSDLLQFMYQGEVQVSQENLTTFIKTAEALQIKGLTGDGNGSTECDNEPHDEPPKPSEVETPKVTTRPKKIHHSPAAPPAKRPRTSVTEQNVTTAVTKTEPAASSTPTNEQLIQFKMEPYDQSQSTVTIPDDNPDETFTDDPLDESNADDGNEDYSMMEGGDEEPQAGTSADGTAGEGQGMFHFIRSAWAGDLLVTQEQVYKCVQTVKGKKLWKCYKPTCQAKCYTKNGKVVVRMGLHSHDIPRRYLKEKAHQGKMFVKKLT
jgi:hypothetical protein